MSQKLAQEYYAPKPAYKRIGPISKVGLLALLGASLYSDTVREGITSGVKGLGNYVVGPALKGMGDLVTTDEELNQPD